MHCVCLEKLHVAWLCRPCFLFTRSLISAYSGQLLILPLPQPPPTIHPRASLPSASLAVALNNTDKFTQLERAPLLTFAFASSATLRKYLPQFFILNDSQGGGGSIATGSRRSPESGTNKNCSEGCKNEAQLAPTAINLHCRGGAGHKARDEVTGVATGEVSLPGPLWRMYTRLQHIFGAAGSGTQA